MQLVSLQGSVSVCSADKIVSAVLSLHHIFSKVYESKLQELQKQVETRSLAAETPDEEEEDEEEDEGSVF